MPSVGFSMSEMTPLLSAYGIGTHGTPSSLYCFSSPVKTVMRKNCCSFSLAKLMQSCSKELVSKNSKPYTSSSPMYRLQLAWSSTAELIRATTKAKRRAYMILTIASRASAALYGVCGLTIVLPRAVIERVSRFVAMSAIPSSPCAFLSTSPFCTLAASSLPNSMLPSSSVAWMKSQIWFASASFTPTVAIASCTSLNSFTSSTPSMVVVPDIER